MKRRSQPKARTSRRGISKYEAKQSKPGTLGEVQTNAMDASTQWRKPGGAA